MKKRNDVLRQALIAADEEYFKNIEKNSTVEWTPSAQFEQNMQELIHGLRHVPFYRRPAFKKFACTAAIVLVLVGSMLSVTAIRKPIVNFFVSICENFSTLLASDVDRNTIPQTIEIIYLPTRISDDYHLIETNTDKYSHEIIYEGQQQSTIRLIQSTLYGTRHTLDKDESELIPITVGSYEGNYFISDDVTFIIWTTEDYAFRLAVPSSFSLDEAVAIAESLEPQS